MPDFLINSEEVSLWLDQGWRLVVLLLAAIASQWLARTLLIGLIHKLASLSSTSWDDHMVGQRVFHRIAHLVPALVIYFGALPFFATEPALWLQRISLAYMAIIGVLVVFALLNGFLSIYNTYEVSKSRTLKGVVQTLQILIGLFGAIITLAILMDVSPWKFLSGIGALSAILLLVFKDSILGLVASIQVSTNNMVQIGDWIEMPKYGADGEVIDISLTTVKVQNWDKTISTIPTYGLVSDPVKNWRGMSEADGRRIKRSLSVDMQTVRFCTEEMLNRFEQFQHVAEYIKQRRQEVKLYNAEHNIDPTIEINGRRLTNLGCFRAYLEGYLRHHPMVNKKMTFLVRHLAPTDKGLPIEIYVFSADKVWANYEAIQAGIFDHILAAISCFDLAVYQAPSGKDVNRALARVSSGS